MSPLSPWFLSVECAEDDNPDDGVIHPKPDIKISITPTKTEEKTGFFGFFSKKSDIPQSVDSQTKVTPPIHIFGSDKSFYDFEGVDHSDLVAAKGSLWHSNRYGDGRIIAIDPFNKSIRARYDIDGNLIVGDHEIPVFRNERGNSQTPWMIVQTFREALIAHKYYRFKFKEVAQNIPHIVWFAKDSDIKTLLPWLPPMPSIYVAHGKRENSLLNAKKIGNILSEQNISFDYRPKLPVPSMTHMQAKN
jgi:hypothetical protein